MEIGKEGGDFCSGRVLSVIPAKAGLKRVRQTKEQSFWGSPLSPSDTSGYSEGQEGGVGFRGKNVN